LDGGNGLEEMLHDDSNQPKEMDDIIILDEPEESSFTLVEGNRSENNVRGKFDQYNEYFNI
jgi:hypothetical protein